jgi:hypothetical protein
MRAERNALRSCEMTAERQVMLVFGIPVRGATIAQSSAAKRLLVMRSNAGDFHDNGGGSTTTGCLGAQ